MSCSNDRGASPLRPDDCPDLAAVARAIGRGTMYLNVLLDADAAMGCRYTFEPNDALPSTASDATAARDDGAVMEPTGLEYLRVSQRHPSAQRVREIAFNWEGPSAEELALDSEHASEARVRRRTTDGAVLVLVDTPDELWLLRLVLPNGELLSRESGQRTLASLGPLFGFSVDVRVDLSDVVESAGCVSLCWVRPWMDTTTACWYSGW